MAANAGMIVSRPGQGRASVLCVVKQAIYQQSLCFMPAVTLAARYCYGVERDYILSESWKLRVASTNEGPLKPCITAEENGIEGVRAARISLPNSRCEKLQLEWHLMLFMGDTFASDKYMQS